MRVCMHACMPQAQTLNPDHVHTSWIRDMEKRNLHLEEYCVKLGDPFHTLCSPLWLYTVDSISDLD